MFYSHSRISLASSFRVLCLLGALTAFYVLSQPNSSTVSTVLHRFSCTHWLFYVMMTENERDCGGETVRKQEDAKKTTRERLRGVKVRTKRFTITKTQRKRARSTESGKKQRKRNGNAIFPSVSSRCFVDLAHF